MQGIFFAERCSATGLLGTACTATNGYDPVNGSLRARLFTAADWPWVVVWFRDSALDVALGPLDEEWFHTVTNETNGVQLVVVDADSNPVGLVGIFWDTSGLQHVITDIAVDPSLRRNGLGRAVLKASTDWPDHPPAHGWAAFVDPNNRNAVNFFSALGWVDEGLKDGMHRFVSNK